MNSIKGIILDVDGVIIGKELLPHPNIISLIKSIKQRGISIFLCTAKPIFGVKNIIDTCRLDDFNIVDGGAVLANASKDTINKKYIIDKDKAIKIINAFLENNIYVEVNTVDYHIIQSNQECDITQKHSFTLQQNPIVTNDLIGKASLEDIVKIVPVAFNDDEKQKIESIFKSMNTDLTFNWGIIPIALPAVFGVITATGVSKRQGAIDISTYSGILFENMLGIGDGIGDWDFLELCKYRGIMGNASNELKNLVKSDKKGEYYIGGDVKNNGLIEILNYFLEK